MVSTWPSLLYIMRGGLFLRAHRVLWKYAAAPLAISVIILVGGTLLFLDCEREGANAGKQRHPIT